MLNYKDISAKIDKILEYKEKIKGLTVEQLGYSYDYLVYTNALHCLKDIVITGEEAIEILEDVHNHELESYKEGIEEKTKEEIEKLKEGYEAKIEEYEEELRLLKEGKKGSTDNKLSKIERLLKGKQGTIVDEITSILGSRD